LYHSTDNLLKLLDFRKNFIQGISMRTRSSLADSSGSDGVDDDCTGTDEPGANVARWQRKFATFLSEASTALTIPYFYLLQANGWKSMCLLTGLSVEVYSALLLECRLVDIDNYGAGRRVCVNKRAWEDFFVRFNLMSGYDRRGSCVEITSGRINISAIQRTMMGGYDLQPCGAKNMFVLRVGKVPEGKQPPKCTAINNRNSEPPGINHGMRMAKMKLCESTMELQSIIDDSKMADIATVMAWVLMSDNTEQHVGSKRKHAADDDDEDEVDDRARQSTLNIASMISPATAMSASNVRDVAPPPLVLLPAPIHLSAKNYKINSPRYSSTAQTCYSGM
jgi:hypothetical protein